MDIFIIPSQTRDWNEELQTSRKVEAIYEKEKCSKIKSKKAFCLTAEKKLIYTRAQNVWSGWPFTSISIFDSCGMKSL